MLTRNYRGVDGVQLAALIFVALALVPGGAHLASLPNKISRAPEAYMVMQQAYSGWALFGIVIYGALLTTALISSQCGGSTVPSGCQSALSC